MKTLIRKTDRGSLYLSLDPTDITWHSFPEIAQRILRTLRATDIEDCSSQNSVDMHWYEFRLNNCKFRLVYEDWPHTVSIEAVELGATESALATLQNLLEPQ